jgi:hypothetical protein
MACGCGSKGSTPRADAGAGGSGESPIDSSGSIDGARRDAGGAGALEAGIDGCQAPEGATALCLTFSPESITAEASPGLDQRGYLTLQVFDTPAPPGGAVTSATALYDRTFPADFETGGEVALADLPERTVVFSDAPPTVYVRALFFDHGGVDEYGGLRWGTWLGGLDLARGIVEDTGLFPVRLTPGQVTTHAVPLTAMRRLSVTVTTSATPVGDGEGALSVVASRVEGLPPQAPTHGYGIQPCVDLAEGPQTVEMVLLGSGTFFVTGFFDDLGIETPGEVPPGTLLSLRDFDPSTGDATFDRVTFLEDQYSARLSIDLGFVTDFRGDPSTIGPNSCADLGFLGAP